MGSIASDTSQARAPASGNFPGLQPRTLRALSSILASGMGADQLPGMNLGTWISRGEACSSQRWACVTTPQAPRLLPAGFRSSRACLRAFPYLA
jgi:hypothetical protein